MLPDSRTSPRTRPAIAGETFIRPLMLMMFLYFVIGFITELNDVLIPHFRDLFHLSNAVALLVQLSFFGAYFVMSLPCSHLVAVLGYQRSIALALVMMGSGLFLFVPASYVAHYWMFLGALFIVGSGLALLQVAINPYVGALGRDETAAARLNLAGGFNSIGGTLAPRIGAALIFIAAGASAEELAHSLRLSYLTLAVLCFAMAAMAWLVRLPKLLEEKASESRDSAGLAGAWAFRRLRYGTGAIFAYVGAEVAIGSLMINFFAQTRMGGLSHLDAARYVSMYWGGAMLGRFVGAYVLRYVSAQRALVCVSLAAMAALLVVMTQHGSLARAALVSCGLFNSVMWPCIFPLSLKGMGRYTTQGSGLLVMMVVGGAIVPEIQGWVADLVGYGPSFLVVCLCYAYILYFAIRVGSMNGNALSTHDVMIPVETV